jgi:hypothetical protein
MGMLTLLSLWAAVVFSAILVLLHFLKPELDPSWRVISEYENGRWGVLMRLAFACLSVSCFALAAIFWQHVWTFADLLLMLAASGPLIAAIFAPDPIITPRSSKTNTGRWHDFGGILFIFGFPVAVTLITVSAGDPMFAPLHSWLLWLLVMVWIGLLTFFVALFYYRKTGSPNPDMKIGWPNRLLVFTYLTWIILMAATLLERT